MNPGKAGAAKHPQQHSGWKPAILSFFAYWVTRLVGLTWRLELRDESGQLQTDSGRVFIFAIWHNRIGIMPVADGKYVRRERLAALVSASRDGELLARTLQRFGYQPVRGSTSRRGPQSLLEMVRYVAEGYDAVITPDGPRGPAEVVQPGIVQLAKVTEVPITPVSCSVSHCIRLKSWDRFIIPWPFARIVISVGRPIAVPREADGARLESKRIELEQALRKLGDPPPEGRSFRG